MQPAVAKALEEIRATFPEAVLTVHEDGNGGAWFFADGVDAGDGFIPQRIWIGADISPQYPYADVYPVFVSPELRRSDGSGLGEAISPNVGFHGRNSLQISRRSNHRDPGLETAAMKLQKVLAWLSRRK
jgi:hypothetical protein